MVFSSSTFLLVFLPVFLAVYFILPWRTAKNIWLLCASLVFYAWGEPVYIVLMLCSIALNWALALWLQRTASEAARKALLAICVAANLAILCFFKYEGFLAHNINALLGIEAVPDLALPLPVGISFFTLQALSYVADVYRREVPAQPNPLLLGMYIAMFPQLIAGPIVRYSTIADQIAHRTESLAKFCQGMRIFIVGLAKKVLLANTMAVLADKMLQMGGPQMGAVGAWAGLFAYAFQIYFDFAGYSDMAIGLGKMLGFDYLRNFNYPYIATSARGFWRRWHISLSTFFRDYVYIPLGGSRVKTGRWVVNMAVVWALTGVWHGAAWNFVLWGVYWGVLLVVERLFLGRLVERLPRPFQHIYGIASILFGWLVFWVEDVAAIGPWLAAMFGAWGATGASTLWELTAWEYLPVFAVCVLASVPVVPYVRARLVAWCEGRSCTVKEFMERDLPAPKQLSTDALLAFDPDALDGSAGRKRVLQVVALLCDLALVALLVGSVAAVVSGSFNPFIYFRF